MLKERYRHNSLRHQVCGWADRRLRTNNLSPSIKDAASSKTARRASASVPLASRLLDRWKCLVDLLNSHLEQAQRRITKNETMTSFSFSLVQPSLQTTRRYLVVISSYLVLLLSPIHKSHRHVHGRSKASAYSDFCEFAPKVVSGLVLTVISQQVLIVLVLFSMLVYVAPISPLQFHHS
jgi:hypothetical protein